jgi:hypothetical protein
MGVKADDGTDSSEVMERRNDKGRSVSTVAEVAEETGMHEGPETGAKEENDEALEKEDDDEDEGENREAEEEEEEDDEATESEQAVDDTEVGGVNRLGWAQSQISDTGKRE